MLTRLAVAAAAALLAAGCGGDGDGGQDPGDALAERVVAALGDDAELLGGAVDGARATCPDVESPDAGDRATCAVRLADGRTVDVDLEFDRSGSFAVVSVVSP